MIKKEAIVEDDLHLGVDLLDRDGDQYRVGRGGEMVAAGPLLPEGVSSLLFTPDDISTLREHLV